MIVAWSIVAAVVLIGLYMLLFGSNAIAVARTGGSQVKVSKGSFNPAFLREIERVAGQTQGQVRVEPEHNYMVLKFKGGYSEQQRQALTNLFPHENYRAACSAFKTYR
jgi:hypothetical protein